MPTDLLLGIDIGTTNCKAILFDSHGHPVSAGNAPTPTYHPQPGWFEHEPEQLWQTIAATIRQALIGIDANRIRGIAVASVGEAGVLVDATGQELCPMIAWHDARSATEMECWRMQIDQDWADTITAFPIRPIATLFKLQWIRTHWPEAYQQASRWLFAADYVAFRLCGEQATDYSLASRSLLFDLRARCWSDALMEAAGLRGSLLPTLRPAGSPLGAVSHYAAAETGLPTSAIVGVGGHDHIVGALAANITQSGQCLDSLGTAEVTFLPLNTAPSVALAQASGATFGAHVAQDRYFLLDTIQSSGAAVSWIRSLLLPNSNDFSGLEELATTAPAGCRGALFLPRLAAGEQGCFAGLTLACGPPEMARAVYEGLAYSWREMLERAEATLGVHVDQIRLIGGGIRSPIWTRVKADVLGRPLEILELEEGVALGAAMLGGLAARVYQHEADALAQVRIHGRILEPNQALADIYDQYYHERFLPLLA